MKLSVIVPCRAEQEFERTIASVLAQEFSDREIVLVDDTGNDRAGKLVRKLATRGDAISIVRVESQGSAAAARNAGLDRAKGEYVAFLDPGDTWEPNVAGAAIADLELFPWADAIEFGTRLVDAPGDIEPPQLAAIGAGFSGNLVVRRAAAAFLEGFPTDERLAQRGGDVAFFRLALRRWGTVGSSALVHLDHAAAGCPLVAHALNTTRLAGDRLESAPPDDIARGIDAALREQLQRLDVRMLETVGNPRLHRIGCELGGRRFDFEVLDRPEVIGQANAALTQGEYPMLPFLGSVQTILEVGAGSGTRAVNLTCNHAGARVIALEPAQLNYVLLRRNAMAHPRIETYKLGLFTATTRLDFQAPGAAARERVLLADVSTFLQSLRVDRIDLLRLDNSGVEVAALLAFGERLKDTKAIIVRYRRDKDRRLIDEILTSTHLLYWGRIVRPHDGELLFVQRSLLGPDGRA